MSVRMACLFVFVAGFGFVGCEDKGGVPLDDTGEAAGPLAFDLQSSGQAPLDATPNADGSEIWYIGMPGGEPSLLHVDAAGQTSVVVAGAPMVSPQSLSVSADDSLIYIADPGADDGGAILTVAGATVSVLLDGVAPLGVHAESDGSVLFTGQSEGSPGVFRYKDELSTLALGGALSEPAGVVSTPDGGVFVTDGPGRAGEGRLLSISDGTATVLLDGLTLGDPAGLSCTLDGAVLVISAIDPDSGNDVVTLYDRASGTASSTMDGIEGNTHGGGVHRAAEANIWAWADYDSGGGAVYRVSLR